MVNCPICGEPLLTLNNEAAEQLINVLEKLKPTSLIKSYPHIFNFCSKCAISELMLREEDKGKLIEKRDSLIETLYNKELEDIDSAKWARIAEIHGFCNEILGNYKEAILGYQAATDIIDALMQEYVEANKMSTNNEGDMVAMNPVKLEKLNRAMEYSNNLKRLTLGHILKVLPELKENEAIILLIYIDNLIELRLNDKAQAIIDTLLGDANLNDKMRNVVLELNEKNENMIAFIEE